MIPVQKGFVFDLNKCTGCQACGVACKIENGTSPEIDWREVHTFNELRHPALPVFHLSMACNHCVDPPCLRYCPALAYNKDASTGAVTIDPDKCIGCQYCSWNCPYDAPRFNVQQGVMEKCTFCNHRLEQSLAPSCVVSCPTGALGIEDYQGTQRDTVAGFTPTSIQPAIRLIPLNGPVPEAQFPAVDAEMYQASLRKLRPRITARSEWPLLVFTMAAAVLTAWLASCVVQFGPVHPWMFLIAGASAMFLSTLHLGRKLRAYRAIFNWRRSWLSREILFFSAFLSLAGVYFLKAPGSAVAGYAAVLTGAAALISIDQVYQVIAVQNLPALHSAQVIWTALLLSGAVINLPELWVAAAVFKFVLYTRRKLQQGNAASLPSAARILLGLVLPLLLHALNAQPFAVVLSLFAGEVIDRCEFYSELNVASPAAQMRQDLQQQLRTLREQENVAV